jgi:CRISPR/Cas system-associated exonuclease Cas4 (RecB family)
VVEAALGAVAGGAAPDPADVAKLVAWIDAFRRSELGREVAAAPRADVRREQAFLLRAGRTVVRGQIDLLWRCGGRWNVLDWKTGRIDPPRAEHALQLRLYALGVRAVTGTLPARLLLWSLPAGRAAEVPLAPEEVRATESLLEEFSARTAIRDWRPPQRPPCEDCRVRAACHFSTVR